MGILVTPGFCQASRFLMGAKTKKPSFFNLTYLATWECASEMAATGQLRNFL